MKNSLFCAALMLSLAIAHPARAYNDGVELASTPKVVQTTINARIIGGKLDTIEASKENGEVTFDIDWTDKSGKDRSFTVADDGTVISEEVDLADVPAPVQRTIKEQAVGFELESLEKSVEDPSDISYNVEVGKDGKSKWFSVAADGSVSSKSIALNEAPAAVQAIVKQRAAGSEIKSVEENFEDGITFDITLNSGGVEKSFSVSLAGAVVSEQMDVESLPDGVKTTIHEHIGNGKVIRVDRNLAEKRNNVFPFEVHGRKDGKPFDFSVGPRGRFLGMD